MFDHGMEEVLDIQRRFNELDRLMFLQQRMSAATNPEERLREMMMTREEFSKRVDELMEEMKPKS